MTDSVSNGDLLDVNVWLALAVKEHVHHAPAMAYWHETEARRRHFCRVSALSLVRLLMHGGLMANAPLSLPQAWEHYRRWRDLPGVALVDETPTLEHVLEKYIAADLPARHFTDAYFAALCTSTGLRLISFDKDFRRFAGLNWLQLRA